MFTSRLRLPLAILALVSVPVVGRAQSSLPSVVDLTRLYRVVPNVTYVTANNFEAKLDVYTPREATGPVPTVIFIHGGWWLSGSKEASVLQVLPYMERGFAAVNVEYRLGRVSVAPGAVEDCRCALRWIYQNARQYKFDLDNIVTTGQSAGGHLALTTAMIPESAGLDRQCPGDRRRAWTTGDLGTQEMKVDSRSYPEGLRGEILENSAVSPNYLETLGVRVLDGRSINDTDINGSPDVVVINQTMAERYWPKESAVGRTVQVVNPTRSRTYRVVGVVSNHHRHGVLEAPSPMVSRSVSTSAAVSRA